MDAIRRDQVPDGRARGSELQGLLAGRDDRRGADEGFISKTLAEKTKRHPEFQQVKPTSVRKLLFVAPVKTQEPHAAVLSRRNSVRSFPANRCGAREGETDCDVWPIRVPSVPVGHF